MPLYEYSCEECGRRCELLVRGDERPRCPHCEGTRLTKLLSVVAGHVAKGDAGGCGRPQCGMGGCAGLE